jgi:hypothetical protein
LASSFPSYSRSVELIQIFKDQLFQKGSGIVKNIIWGNFADTLRRFAMFTKVLSYFDKMTPNWHKKPYQNGLKP